MGTRASAANSTARPVAAALSAGLRYVNDADPGIRRLKQGRGFRYVVITHHHIDHSGGVRAYAAEGATVVVGKGEVVKA